MAKKTERAEGERGLTNQDWGKIHAKAWSDEKFKSLLESDPTAAIRAYADEELKRYKRKIDLSRIVKLRPAPDDIPEEFWEDVNPFPPSCC